MQRVMNAAARVIMARPSETGIKTTSLLPVEYRIVYKLCLYMYYIWQNMPPWFLCLPADKVVWHGRLYITENAD